jgi:transcriptional regulator with XRE-family HTH domain
MKERILEFLKAENKSSAQFAEEIGVQPSGISHIVSGRNNPSLDFVLKMLDRYKYLSVDWLLFGRGEMYRDKNLQNLLYDTLSGPDKEKTMGLFEVNDNQKPVKNDTTPGADHKELKQNKIILHSDVVKIVWFYSNNSFEEYYPRK